MSEQIEDHVQARFEILKSIGKGAYGIVWKVREKTTDRIYALKKIYDAFYNEIDAQRTYREVMYLKELKGHENIVRLEEVIHSQNDKDLYLVFEYMDADLHHVIKSDILAEVHKKYIIYQLIKALKYIHSAGLIHRDLKPSNLLINSDCLIKIADLGLARSLQAKDGTDPIVSEYVATRWYRAPEILLGSRSYSRAVDVWSAGCILAELFLGRVLFPGKGSLNQMELLMQLLDRPTSEDIIALASEHAESVISSLTTKKCKSFTIMFSKMGKLGIDLLRRMLSLNPQKRITIEEVLNHPFLKEFTSKGDPIPTRSVVSLPIDDNQKMSVSYYRDTLYKMIGSNFIKANQIVIQKNEFDQLLPSANQKSSLSKERFSTKDISEDKSSHLINSLKRGKTNGISLEQEYTGSLNNHCTSQLTCASAKKSVLSKKKSVDKASASRGISQTSKKAGKILKKKRSIDSITAIKSTFTGKRNSQAMLSTKQKTSANPLLVVSQAPKSPTVKNDLFSTAFALRRKSNAYIVPEDRDSVLTQEARKSQIRSISPNLVKSTSKCLLTSTKSAKALGLERKRSHSPTTAEMLKNLKQIDQTEKFFMQFEPFRKKVSTFKVIAPEVKSTSKQRGPLDTNQNLRRVKNYQAVNSSSHKGTGSRSIVSSSQLLNILRGLS